MPSNATKLRRGQRYPLADHVPLTEAEALGVGKRAAIVAVWTGEKRCPKAGEWYLSGAIIEAYRAPNDLTTEYHIAQLEAE